MIAMNSSQEKAYKRLAHDMQYMDDDPTPPPSYDKLLELNRNQQAEIIRLQERISQLINENYELRQRRSKSRTTVHKHVAPAGQMYNGVPVITPKDVAQRTGKDQSTIIRWCQRGHLKAWQPGTSNRWLIASDQSFSPPRKGKSR